MVYALLSILLALGCLVHLVTDWPGTPGPLALGHFGLVAFLCVAALFTGAGYALKAAGAEPEQPLDRGGPVVGAAYAILLLPYTVVAIVVLAVERLMSREPFADEIAPGLWVGGLPMFGDRAAVSSRGVTAVLNMCLEFPDLAGLESGGLHYRRVPVLDGTAPSVARLSTAVDWCDGHLRSGGTVLVHCAQGHGRSALVAMALLLRRGVASAPEDAVRIARAARPGIRLGRQQLAALRAFHEAGSGGGAR